MIGALATDEQKWQWIEHETGVTRDRFIKALGYNSHTPQRFSLIVGDVDEGEKSFVLYHHQSHEIQYIFQLPEKKLFIDRVNMSGVGREIFKRVVDFGQQTKLFDAIKLRAAKHESPYKWVQYGFLPSQDEWDSLRTAPHRLRKTYEESVMPEETHAAVEEVLENPDPASIRKLAALTQKATPERGRREKVGKIMLTGEPAYFYAQFNLNDPVTLETFAAYVNRPRRSY